MQLNMKRTWQKITADKRRFTLFCTLLFVGLLLWARIIVIARPARTAIAAPSIEIAIASILSSDNIATKVFLESKPLKNPFAVSNEVFPVYHTSTDNIIVGNPVVKNTSENEFIASLKLEAVMGQMAMINGQVVQIGDIVGSKTVQEPLRFVELQGRTVILSAGDRRYELTIAPLHH